MNPFIRLPDHWSPQKVQIILDFVDDVYQAIWDKYGTQLCVYWETPTPPDLVEDPTNIALDDGPPG